MSMPNISLLIPMAEILGVTVTELLMGQKLSQESPLNIDDVEKLVTCSVDMSLKEQKDVQGRRKKWLLIYTICAFFAALEVLFLLSTGIRAEEMRNNVLLVEGLMLMFGGWFCFGAKENLPSYYDKHRINYISSGFFRMDLPGITFNNNNWPHILRVGRCYTLLASILFPVLYAGFRYLPGSRTGSSFETVFVLSAVFGLFLPMYIVGKKYASP